MTDPIPPCPAWINPIEGDIVSFKTAWLRALDIGHWWEARAREAMQRFTMVDSPYVLNSPSDKAWREQVCALRKAIEAAE